MDNASLKCPRILIVEDDPDQRQLIREALCLHYGDAEGRNIQAVGTGREALAEDLSRFDVVLQDYNLPDVAGLSLLRDVLARADLPVIIVTGENVSSTAVEAIQNGAQDYVVKMGEYLFAVPCLVDKSIRQHRLRQENEQLHRRHRQMLQELQDANAQLQESMEKLRMMAGTDPLTGLANRRRFAETLDRCFSEALRYGFDLTCCMCDLDHYKQLNDSHGHQAGDEVLMITADVIRATLRSADVAARYGGDEFVLLLPHTSLDRGLAVGQRIRQELSARVRTYGGHGPPITLSAGIASLHEDRPGSADALVAMADQALYAAKDQGKDRLVAYGQILKAVVSV